MFVINNTTTNAVRIEDSGQLIQSLQPPVDKEQEQHIRAVIEVEAEAAGHAQTGADSRRLTEARSSLDRSRVRLDESSGKLIDAESAEKQAPHGSVVQGVIFGFCALVCLGAEFTLTLVTLPFLLGIRQWSVLGVTVALAPATAVIILDKVMGRLIEDPWQRLRSAMHTRWQRVSAIAVMALFLLGLGAGNVWTVTLLADARERAMELKQALESDQEEALTKGVLAGDKAVIRKAILAVSVVVTLDGALFSLLAICEIRSRRHQERAQRAVAERLAERDACRSALTKCEGEMAEAEFHWQQASDRSRMAAGRFREERLSQLAKAKRWPSPNGNGPALVNTILTSYFRGDSASPGTPLGAVH